MDTQALQIQKKIDRVREQIARAAHSVGRNGADIRLVVVTKGQPVETIRAAVQAGARILGENYPEETVPKIQALRPTEGVSWHMIGHLQSRKANLVVANFDLLESLDSLRLAARLNQQAGAASRVLPVMLEFNVSGEESKFGWPAWDEMAWNQLLPEVEKILAMPSLSVRGLMTMPPYSQDPNQTRPYFVRLRRLRDFFAARFSENFFIDLSMGTSVDFEVAVQEGATLVRIGEAILGPRPGKK